MVNDRRIFERLDDIVNVRYAVKDRDKAKIESLPRNIGGGGLAICLTEKLDKGTVLKLEITATDNPQNAILGVGEVLWTKAFGMINASGQDVNLYETGIRFININPLAIGRVYASFRQLRRV